MTLLKNKSIATFLTKSILQTNQSSKPLTYIASDIEKKCRFKMCCFIKPLNPFALNLHSIFSLKFLALEPNSKFSFFLFSQNFRTLYKTEACELWPIQPSSFAITNYLYFESILYSKGWQTFWSWLVDLGCIK